MLNLPSIILLRSRTEARPERRDSRRSEIGARPTYRARGIAPGEGRVETKGAAEGTTGTAMLGCGGGGILAALPMPLGSLTELF